MGACPSPAQKHKAEESRPSVADSVSDLCGQIVDIWPKTSTRIELWCATKTCSSQRENVFEVLRCTWKCNGAAAPTLIFYPYSALVAPCTSASSPSDVFKGQLCHISKYAPCDSPDWSSARWMHKISDSKSKIKYQSTYFSYAWTFNTCLIWNIQHSRLLSAFCTAVTRRTRLWNLNTQEYVFRSLLLARSLFSITWCPSHEK